MCILKILIANRRGKCCACSKHTLQRATSISRRHQGAKCECQMRFAAHSVCCVVASLRVCIASVYDLENFSSSHWIYRLTARRCYELFSLRRLASPPPPAPPVLFALCVCSWQAASWLNLTLASLLWPVAAILLLLLLPLLLLLLLLPANI